MGVQNATDFANAYAAGQTANTTYAPQESSWFDPKEWLSGSKDILTALAVGKINKMYQLDLSSHVMAQKAPNGSLSAQGAEAAYDAAASGAVGNALHAAGWLQKNGIWLAIGGAGLLVAWLVLRK